MWEKVPVGMLYVGKSYANEVRGSATIMNGM